MEEKFEDKNHINKMQNQILSKTKYSICKIEYMSTVGSGFFINLEKNTEEGMVKTIHCLMSCEHVIEKEMIESKKEIKIYYHNKKKSLIITLDSKKRYIRDYTNMNIDATVVEILPEDNIPSEYFLTPNLDYMDKFEGLLNKPIYILHYPKGEKLLFTYGRIREIDNYTYKFGYSNYTDYGSSGGPVFLDNTSSVIGIHKARAKNFKGLKYGDFLGTIYKLFKDNSLSMSVVYNHEKESFRINFHDKNNMGIHEYFKKYLRYIDKIYENKKKIFEGKAKFEIEMYRQNNEAEGKIIYPDGNYYKGHLKDFKRHGKGIYYDKNNKPIYKGNFIFDEYDGEGILKIENITYKGFFKKGLRHGKGKLVIPNMFEYIGNFEEGVIEGDGILTASGIGKYIGKFHNDCRHGYGEQYDEDNNLIYKGGFLNDLFDGEGILFYRDGDYYEGEFKNGKRHGKGTQFYNNKTIEYKGDFYNNKIEGYGRYNFKDGQYYIGQFKNNKKHGKGTLYYENKNIKYNGDFVDDKPEGKGIFLSEKDSYYKNKDIEKNKKYNNSIIYEGDFINSKFEGNGVYYHPDGEISMGQFKNNFRNGNIIMLYPDHTLKYEGEFKNNLPNGKGIFRKPDGFGYVGDFVDGKFEGKGKLYDYNKLRFEGNFVKGKQEGDGMLFLEDKYYFGNFHNNGVSGILLNKKDNKIIYEGDIRNLLSNNF